ncbi:tRNA (adenosine(37)-N6)-threonylcarbamoyltransferase complex dimerization subunit type 1 TsaB [Listeria aquatica]|uniref:tRNA (Adenosine(37)-N6)-threonylcarbamoyltransferase complex dimerization subunit type 1 TsaB n=1 Tax=Listeria aquatica TaxID=1494960 RepID=A0A841ZN46_9LIST|nr:tRNA (adenosine(37)-N6)-threonylcarbamoyltransferase complex dimerization subunit type 1 TsaB [Listeria aquatica]MBC1520420.1 tRNA (adenosine(37)-N6)-threonylcarbamoyltransferase complex dimerization subunit type 1 TsaB [Listeria aquatica]
MILGIDTATDTMSIALSNSQRIVGEFTTNLKKNHSIRLLPAIQALLEECQVKPNELTKIAVSRGPGSFTGLRIGVTTAKTLSYELEIPLVGISSLQVLAQNAIFFEGPIVALMDARRNNVYAGIYEAQQGALMSTFPDQHIALSELLSRVESIQKSVLFVGVLPETLQEIITEKLGEKAIFAPSYMTYPRAASLVALAENEPGEDSMNFVPSYLKLAEAESKWLEARKKQ